MKLKPVSAKMKDGKNLCIQIGGPQQKVFWTSAAAQQEAYAGTENFNTAKPPTANESERSGVNSFKNSMIVRATSSSLSKKESTEQPN